MDISEIIVSLVEAASTPERQQRGREVTSLTRMRTGHELGGPVLHNTEPCYAAGADVRLMTSMITTRMTLKSQYAASERYLHQGLF
jgi:hypothetical protein